MATIATLTGGAFQDASGNPIANGYILVYLNQNGVTSNTPGQQLASGQVIKLTLGSDGNLVAGQKLWPNDGILPAGTTYVATLHAANGQVLWGPNTVSVLSTPSPYDIGAWVPTSVSAT
jgi:hypothetical protein